jgi:transposase InsO family protein
VLRRPLESTQYVSLAYGSYAKGSGIDLSMGSIGDPWDNALAETFFASLEKELLRRERFATREAARMRLFWYIECFYNTRRRHSALGYLSPAEYEQHHAGDSGPFGPADPVQPASRGALAGVGTPSLTTTTL